MDATTADEESIIGDECHIVAKHLNGPRGNESITDDQLNHYNNLILLCKTHHKMIDDQPMTYTAEMLKKLKLEHEKWVRTTLQSSQRKADSGSRLIKLPRITQGKELVSLLTQSHAYYHDYDEPQTQAQIDLITDFFSNFEDVWVLDQPSELIRVGVEFSRYLAALEMVGYCVYGVVTKGKYSFLDQVIDDWKAAFIVVSRRKQDAVLVQHKQ